MKMLFCDVCNTKITIGEGEQFDYTKDGEGPFCGTCWFFVLHIEALRDRVTDIEAKALKDRGEQQRQENIRNANRHGPYETGAHTRTRRTCDCGCGYKYLSGECKHP